MKKFLLSSILMLCLFGAKAQLVPLIVYNGTSQTLVVHSAAVLGVSPACAPGGTSAAIGLSVAPGATITVAPFLPGNPAVDWAAVKITTSSGSGGIGAVHPHFYGCFGIGGNWGTPVMTDYWYPIMSSPAQVLKIY